MGQGEDTFLADSELQSLSLCKGFNNRFVNLPCPPCRSAIGKIGVFLLQYSLYQLMASPS